MALKTLSDAELVALCRQRDEDAWNELVDRFSRYVWAIAIRAYGLGQRDAEDVFQEVFLRTWQHLHRLRSDDAIRPWIAQLTRRLCVDRIRDGRRDTAIDNTPEPVDHDRTLEDLADALAVRVALSQLPDHCREILDAFYTRDESYATIGATLGIPGGTIASRISRCLDRLRVSLGEHSQSPAVG